MHLEERLDELGNSAEEYLEELPVHATHEEILENADWTNSLYLYEEVVEYYNVIRQELSYGKDIDELSW